MYSLGKVINILRARNDKEYAGKLILANSDLIWFSIRKYVIDPHKIPQHYGFDKEDLFQVACIAFLNAIEKYDETKGIRFTSYVVPAIVREVRHFMRDYGHIIKPPRNRHELYLDIRKEQEKSGFSFDYKEIAERLGEDEGEVIKALSLQGRAPKYIEEDTDFYLRIPDDRIEIEGEVLGELESIELLEAIREYCTGLPPVDRRIIVKYMQGWRQLDIIETEGVSITTYRRVINSFREHISELNQQKQG